MSIFEPIPRESDADDAAQVVAESAPAGGRLNPLSIKIAGVLVAALVVAGLVVSNLAEPADTRPIVGKRVDPGAAAVEQAEASEADGQPTTVPSASPSASAEPAEPDSTGDEPEVKDSERDDKADKGRGHGRGRD